MLRWSFVKAWIRKFQEIFCVIFYELNVLGCDSAAPSLNEHKRQ